MTCHMEIGLINDVIVNDNDANLENVHQLSTYVQATFKSSSKRWHMFMIQKVQAELRIYAPINCDVIGSDYGLSPLPCC